MDLDTDKIAQEAINAIDKKNKKFKNSEHYCGR